MWTRTSNSDQTRIHHQYQLPLCHSQPEIATLISINSPFYQPHCTACRLPQSHCCCEQLAATHWPFEILLLTHASEWQKQHNTGQWLLQCQDGNIQRVRWARKMPMPRLHTGDYLLYPSADAEIISTSHAASIKRLWVIDSTWQQANKILRQTPWLAQLPMLQLANTQSEFTLRRNQQSLCTMESVIGACQAAKANYAPQAALNNFHLLQNAFLSISSSL